MCRCRTAVAHTHAGHIWFGRSRTPNGGWTANFFVLEKRGNTQLLPVEVIVNRAKVFKRCGRGAGSKKRVGRKKRSGLKSCDRAPMSRFSERSWKPCRRLAGVLLILFRAQSIFAISHFASRSRAKLEASGKFHCISTLAKFRVGVHWSFFLFNFSFLFFLFLNTFSFPFLTSFFRTLGRRRWGER